MAIATLGGIFKRPVDLRRSLRLAADPAASQPPERGPARSVVLSRGLLLHRWMDLKTVPRGKRAAVLSAQLMAWSPFEQSDFRIVRGTDGASMFAWDRSRLAERLREVGAAPALLGKVLPESWLVPGPQGGTGVRLMQGFDGFEGQVWQDGGLRASRYWPELPEELDWLNFLRGASVSPDQLLARDAARVGKSTWQPNGWGSLLAPADLRDRSAVWEGRVLWWSSLAFVAATTVVAKDAWLQEQTRVAMVVKMAELRESTAPVIKARESALDNLARAHGALELQRRPDALMVMAHLVQRLNSDGGTILRELDLNGLAVRVALTVPPNMQRGDLVKGLESGGWLVDVTESAGTGADLVLTMRLQGDKPPKIKADEPSPAASAR